MNSEEKILLKLEELKKYAKFLKENRDTTVFELDEDLKTRYAIEKVMQNALQSTLDIGEIIIAKEGFEKPETNREVIQILGKHGILSKKFAEKFAPSMGLRNILVHKYGDIDIEKLHQHLQEDVKDFKIFAKHITNYIKKRKK